MKIHIFVPVVLIVTANFMKGEPTPVSPEMKWYLVFTFP
jgi:hypothetical protein